MKKTAILLIIIFSFAFLSANLTLADTTGDYRELLADLRLDAALLAKFNLLFGLNLQGSGELNASELSLFTQIVKQENYNKGIFLSALNKSADLLTSFKKDSSLLSGFNKLFALDISSSGNLTPEERGVLFDLTASPDFELNTFLTVLPTTYNLYTTLNAKEEALTTLNKVFATQISPQSDLTAKDRGTLFGIAASPGFNQKSFMEVLPKVDTLLKAVTGDSQSLANFNRTYNTAISSEGEVPAPERNILFDIAGTPGFNAQDFIAIVPRVDTLGETIKKDIKLAQAFNELFDAKISPSENVTSKDRGTLFDVAGDPAFNQQAFTEALPKVEGLNEALKKDTQLSEDFNALFDTALSPSKDLASKDKGALFDVAGSPGFNKEDFIAVLPKTQDLLEVLKNDKGAAEDFNNLFNTDISPDKNLAPKERGTLFDVAGGPEFKQESFLEALPKTNALSETLKADKEAAATFDNLFNTDISSTGGLKAKDRGAIFDVSGDPNFNQDKFLAALPGAEKLYKAIATNNDITNAFNQVFSTNISGSGALVPGDRGILFDVSAAPGFNQDKFLEILPKAANLLALLRANPQSVIDNFNAGFNANISKSGPLSGATKGALFDITGGPYYNASLFLQSLGGTTSVSSGQKNNIAFVPHLADESDKDRLLAPLSP